MELSVQASVKQQRFFTLNVSPVTDFMTIVALHCFKLLRSYPAKTKTACHARMQMKQANE